VHSDYNGKNLLVHERGGCWSISAVLDWEFAFSGSPLTDIGNMLRFRTAYPACFASAFITGYREAGGNLPPDWREVSADSDECGQLFRLKAASDSDRLRTPFR
jgi:aminoglycoside phosphotransferase (APT) family kinase protein